MVLPDNLKEISNAFSGYKKLESITIPDRVSTIGSYAFADCTSLTSITLPDSVTSIGEGAFSYCTSLTSITLPNSAATIYRYAFGNCTSLTSITIPENISDLDDMVFKGCTSLKTVNWNAIKVNYADDFSVEGIFTDCTNIAVVNFGSKITYIPRGMYAPTSATINFEGTIEQWKKIKKFDSYFWNRLTIHCTDGDYTKSGS